MTGLDCSLTYRARPRLNANPSPFGAVSAGTSRSGVVPFAAPSPTPAGRFSQVRPAPTLRLVRFPIPFPLEVPRLTTSNTTGTILVRTPYLRIIRTQGIPAMQTTHPLERLNLAKRSTRRRLIEAFLEGDNTITPKERAVLDEIAMQDEELAEYRARQVAAQSFERNGDTRLTRDRFKDAGFQVVDLSTERRDRRSNVVAFPNRQEAG